MVTSAESLGLEAEWRDNLTLADLEPSLDNGVPVIIDGQRYKEPGKTWEDTWLTGHYMIVIGIDTIIFQTGIYLRILLCNYPLM